MTDSPTTPSVSSPDSASMAGSVQDVAPNSADDGDGIRASSPQDLRRCRDVFWLGIFLFHLVVVGLALTVLGLNRFRRTDRLNIDRYTNGILENREGLTEDYLPLYALAGAVGSIIGWVWLLLLGSHSHGMMKLSVHILTTYLAVISVLCFWGKQFFFLGVGFGVGAVLQFLYVVSVIDRLPFTMMVLRKAVKMVWGIPSVMRVAYVFLLITLLWMAVWSFGVSGVVASSIGDGGRWWLLVVLSVSLFWTSAVLCNTLHVIVSGAVFLVLIHGGGESSSMPSNPLLRSLRRALTTSLGSICYGSLFTAAIRTLRWEIRGFRSKIGRNECLLCCVDFLFHLVEILVRFFNKYAYVRITVSGRGFNGSARDAWELLQSTGVEALVAYDCSGAVLLMVSLLGGLITGTCSGVWAWKTAGDRVAMVASTAMLIGMILVSEWVWRWSWWKVR